MCGKCGECERCKRAAYMRDWSKSNKDKMKRYNNAESRRKANRKTTASRYGLSVEEYDSMYASQRGLCAICNEPETTMGNNGKVKMLSIDHNHRTDKVRGLLCNNCNRAIGLLKDDVSTLLNAIQYIRQDGVKY